MRTIMVLGAGTMGSGIAQVFAAKGHVAMMYASSVASAQRHRDKLAASLNKRVAKGKMAQEALDALLANGIDILAHPFRVFLKGGEPIPKEIFEEGYDRNRRYYGCNREGGNVKARCFLPLHS